MRQRDVQLKNIPSRVLVNRPEEETYRYVLATNESAIKQLIAAKQSNAISNKAVTALLRYLEQAKQYRYLGQIFLNLA